MVIDRKEVTAQQLKGNVCDTASTTSSVSVTYKQYVSKPEPCLSCLLLPAGYYYSGGVWVEVDIVGEQTHTKNGESYRGGDSIPRGQGRLPVGRRNYNSYHLLQEQQPVLVERSHSDSAENNIPS